MPPPPLEPAVLLDGCCCPADILEAADGRKLDRDGLSVRKLSDTSSDLKSMKSVTEYGGR